MFARELQIPYWQIGRLPLQRFFEAIAFFDELKKRDSQ